MSSVLQAAMFLIALVTVTLATLSARSRRVAARKQRIAALTKERNELVVFIGEMEKMAGATNSRSTLKPLRKLLRTCHRLFDEDFFKTAVQHLDQVRQKQEDVLIVSKRIRAVRKADQEALDAAQTALTAARRDTMRLRKCAVVTELDRTKSELTALGHPQ